MRLTTIVLDLDDTLYLERDYVRSGIVAVGDWMRKRRGAADFAYTAQALWDAGQRGHLFDATLAQLGITPDRSLVEALIVTYRAHLPDIHLAPDAAAFLADPLGSRLALITDGPPVAQLRKIEALRLDRAGIDPLIRTGVWGDGFGKPHPRAFRMVEARHGGSGAQMIYVADNPAKDFLGPRTLGWRTVQIDRDGAVHSRTAPSERHRADVTISSLAELEKLVAPAAWELAVGGV
ncbi:HAD family hydrolase [Sphingomonas sp. SUN019]|uniref:HAD family hydrolase n=1 Tax=Sphingomonas sp. SUN019 TaxID=2937788 RepID=UPI00216439D3|nr:HAD family hydrolase [Sphingomonas sp. SUN019]UVO51678.1 HAD family hydrolase [Sphingomonas sp. SUN019]